MAHLTNMVHVLLFNSMETQTTYLIISNECNTINLQNLKQYQQKWSHYDLFIV